MLEKQTLDIFKTLHADELVDRLGNTAEFVVFGVVTEYCVSFAVKGLLERKRRVACVRDAIETLRQKPAAQTRDGTSRYGSKADDNRRNLTANCCCARLISKLGNRLTQHPGNRSRHQVRHGSGQHGAQSQLCQSPLLLGASAPMPPI